MISEHHDPAALPQERDPVPIIQDVVCVRGFVSMGVEERNLLSPPGYEPGTVRALTRRLDEPRSRSGRYREQKNLPPRGFETWIVQLLA